MDGAKLSAGQQKLLQSSPYKKWRAANPAEASAYEAYVAKVASGVTAAAPTLATLFGQGLVLIVSAGVSAPAAKHVTITGTLGVGNTLTAVVA